MDNVQMSATIFQTIGWPIGSGGTVPDAAALETLTEFAFKSRVGLLFLDECLNKGVVLGPKASELHRSLTARRLATDEVVTVLADRLDEVARGEWVLFKSIKPFAATPNDTDWFPLDPSRHAELVKHLLDGDSFELLEIAPRQTTLIHSAGVGVTDTTKKGGVYYIDCYKYPSTDYFIYLDPRRLRGHVTEAIVAGRTVPVLAPHAELTSIMYHNVFPERSFSIESYYLIKSYLRAIEKEGTEDDFVGVCRDQKVEFAAAANLVAVREIDRVQFGIKDSTVDRLLSALKHEDLELPGFAAGGAYPHEFSNRIFWRTFASKLRDRTALGSAGNQALHMLNPVFFADVVKIIWRRCVRGGVYEQN